MNDHTEKAILVYTALKTTTKVSTQCVSQENLEKNVISLHKNFEQDTVLNFLWSWKLKSSFHLGPWKFNTNVFCGSFGT